MIEYLLAKGICELYDCCSHSCDVIESISALVVSNAWKTNSRSENGVGIEIKRSRTLNTRREGTSSSKIHCIVNILKVIWFSESAELLMVGRTWLFGRCNVMSCGIYRRCRAKYKIIGLINPFLYLQSCSSLWIYLRWIKILHMLLRHRGIQYSLLSIWGSIGTGEFWRMNSENMMRHCIASLGTRWVESEDHQGTWGIKRFCDWILCFCHWELKELWFAEEILKGGAYIFYAFQMGFACDIAC